MTRVPSLAAAILLFTPICGAVAREGMPTDALPITESNGDFFTAFGYLGTFLSEQEQALEQTRSSLANDQSANQWIYMFHYQQMEYHTDSIAPGVQRPKGVKRFWQGRFVLPIPKSEKMPVSILPRLTVRYSEAQDGTNGFGTSDLFVLAILSDWGSGRFGLGPMVTFPAADSKLGLTDFTYGLSAGLIQRYLNDRLMVTILAGQTWGPLDPMRPEKEDIKAPLVLNPVAIYNLTDTWYISNGDANIRYDWHKGDWFVPIGLRLGKLWIGEKGSWNLYAEYQTSLYYKDWTGSAIKDQYRLNLAYLQPF